MWTASLRRSSERPSSHCRRNGYLQKHIEKHIDCHSGHSAIREESKPRLKRLNALPTVRLSFGLSLFFSSVFPDTVFGQLGSNVPDDATLVARR
jgi:hypothetical protein